MCQYGVCSIPPLAISRPSESSQNDGGNEDTRTAESSQNEDILSQKVYGELSVLCHFCLLWGVSVKSLTFSSDHPRYLMLFRKHVSRTAADKGRAVLEGVGLDAPRIRTCFEDHIKSVEEAVHTGLIKWCEGQGLQPPTWKVLLHAMSHAEIAQQDIQNLETDLGLPKGTLSTVCDMSVAVVVTDWCWQMAVVCDHRPVAAPATCME